MDGFSMNVYWNFGLHSSVYECTIKIEKSAA